MISHTGNFSLSAHIPRAICTKLRALGNEQRNTRAELFAVLTELFFEQPQALAEEAPGAFAELAGLYGVDPRAWA